MTGAGGSAAWVDWLYPRWTAITGFVMVMLLAHAPLALRHANVALVLIFAFGPLYMAHQLEEHIGDRFRSHVNARLFGGREVLTRGIVLVTNLPLVWGVNLAALYAAVLAGPQWGLASVWLALVNAVVHVAAAIVQRAYNPGLVTALLGFIPLGTIALVAIPASLAAQATGLAVSLLAHAALVGTALARHCRLLRTC